ncbi:MAG: DUF2059 domain-containing protein [Comamonadaceae bacterium]|nr:MAG: DUF2059 domain-containing protein [Comamonadaceae bacterium]
MKKLITAIAIAGFAFSSISHAQTADPKREWAVKVVSLQQGPELDRLVDQLADSTTQQLLATWRPKLQANVPAARLPQVTEQLNAELKKYFEDVSGVIGGKVTKVSTDALVPAYMERFTLDELKQIASFFESPAIKKYQAAAPELGSVFVTQLVEATRDDVNARMKTFDSAADKIIGSKPATAPSSTPKSATPPAKK